eukprot:scaffold614_cov255-Pinguiococcus_pyrenoidosus.AAC.3
MAEDAATQTPQSPRPTPIAIGHRRGTRRGTEAETDRIRDRGEAVEAADGEKASPPLRAQLLSRPLRAACSLKSVLGLEEMGHHGKGWLL